MWLDKHPATAGGLQGMQWSGWWYNITKPDGTTEHHDYTGSTSDIASAFVNYAPDQVGDYTIIFGWPGQTLTNGTGTPNLVGIPWVGDWFQASVSTPFTLHVQQEQIAEWQEPALPTDYWTRPLPTANRGWAQLTSNWLGGSWLREGSTQEYGYAPNTAHVLHATPVNFGGITDERYGAIKPVATDYQNPFSIPAIMTGRIYINENPGTNPKYGYYCIDLKTGEKIWYKNGTDNGLNNPVVLGVGMNLVQTFPQINFGQLLHYYSVNGEGILPYLWMTQSGTPQTATSGGTMWHMVDAYTGNWIMSFKNVPGGTSTTDSMGNLLLVSYNPTTGNFLMWNSTQAQPPQWPTGSSQQQWRPRTGAVVDAVNDRTLLEKGIIATTQTPYDYSDIAPRSGYTLNVTGPTGLPTQATRILRDANGDPKYIMMSFFFNSGGVFPYLGGDTDQQYFNIAVARIDYNVAPYSPWPVGKTESQNNNLGFGVTLLWNKNFSYPMSNNMTWTLNAASYDDNVFTIRSKESRQIWGYELSTGKQIWGPTDPIEEWDMYGMSGNVYDGKLFVTGYGGVLHCYDIKTGTHLWNYTAPGIGHESPYGDYPLSVAGICDDKIYLYSSEHSPTQPLWRGSYLRCINTTDGTEMWKFLDFVQGFGIADGCVVAGNLYDNRLYVYGKGPSATTVTASPKVSTQGTSVLIEGTVTDVSSGAKDIAQTTGTIVPAIADQDQQAYMEYLYMKQAKPTNAKGIEVSLDAIDPNGNYVSIGITTSDSSGMFKKMFTPEVPGEYTIIATFKGSESYGSSYAQTAIGVSETKLTPTSQPVIETQPPYEMYTIGAAIAMIMAIAIATVLILRKRS